MGEFLVGFGLFFVGRWLLEACLPARWSFWLSGITFRCGDATGATPEEALEHWRTLHPR